MPISTPNVSSPPIQIPGMVNQLQPNLMSPPQQVLPTMDNNVHIIQPNLQTSTVTLNVIPGQPVSSFPQGADLLAKVEDIDSQKKVPKNLKLIIDG